MAKTENFPLGTKYSCTTLRVKNSLKISYNFEDIFNVLLSAEIQDGRQKWQKHEIFPLCIGHSCTTLRVKKIAPNHSISYSFRDIHTFSFSTKIQDGRQKC